MKKSKSKDPLAVKDLPLSKGRSSKVQGGYAKIVTKRSLECCNTNTLTCADTCICPEE